MVPLRILLMMHHSARLGVQFSKEAAFTEISTA